MAQHKRSLCYDYFGEDCKSEEKILEIVRNHTNDDGDTYLYNLGDNEKLHSRYLYEFGCYEPAVICNNGTMTWLVWLFDGKIKDCQHPFAVSVDHHDGDFGYIPMINYHSIERVKQSLPIYQQFSHDGNCSLAKYNLFELKGNRDKIVNDPNLPAHAVRGGDRLDMSQFVTIAPNVICPLWSDEFESNENNLSKFKFED